MRCSLLIITLLIAAACNSSQNASNSTRPANVKPPTSPVYTFDIVKTYPHDSTAFTQGLIYYNGFLYEGTGGSRNRGDNFFSSIRKVEITTGKVLQKFDLAPEYFGEGITLLNGKLFQLTWRERTAFAYDINDFKLIKEYTYSGEGWGLTTDGTNLFMSDGTHVIRVVNPEDFKTIRTITVNDDTGKPISKLNELEFIKGEIWSNIWQSGVILRIDPQNGKLLGRIDLSDLMDRVLENEPKADVLNGIAYDEEGDRIFVTGKLWKSLYEVKIRPKS